MVPTLHVEDPVRIYDHAGEARRRPIIKPNRCIAKLPDAIRHSPILPFNIDISHLSRTNVDLLASSAIALATPSSR